jgi:mono/diheme cytochrome c family protein
MIGSMNQKRDLTVLATIGLSLVMVSSLFGTFVALAQPSPGDPDAGHRMAKEICSACHVVETGQAVNPGVGAPDFQTVADNPAFTELALRVFFRTPHHRMPNITLSLIEENDIISYILSLREAGRGSI